MKIVLISDHYPAFPGQATPEISYAIHHFAKYWARTEDVLVIRPWVISGRKMRLPPLRKRKFILDGVTVMICPVIKFPFRRLFWLGALYRTLKKGINADIVVAHLGFNLIFGYKTARKFHLPLVAAVHDGDLLRFGPKMLSTEMMRKIYGYASGIACRSFPLYKKFKDWAPELAEKCFVAFSGVPLESMVSIDEAKSRVLDFSTDGQIRLISVCHLIKRKNIDIVLKSLKSINSDRRWLYQIIGKGPEESLLRDLSKSLGLSPQVRFRGYISREEARRELNNSNIFVMVSANETFGLAYLEAMAAGNLVVAGQGTGVDGIIKSGINGFLCIPGSVEDLASKLQYLLNELTRDERMNMVKESMDTIRKYTEEIAGENYLKALKKSILRNR